MQGLPEESLVGRAMLVADSVARQADRVTAIPPRNRAQDARVTAGVIHSLPTSCFGRIGVNMLSQL
jgi:hypothetical protein